MALLLIPHCPSASRALFLAPDLILNLAQERDLSNVVVVVQSGLSQCWSSDIQPSRPWPKHISQRDVGAMWLGQEVGWDGQGEWLWCSGLIRFHRTPPNYQSAGLYTQGSCVCECFCVVFARAGSGLVCLGRRMRESIARSEGNVSLSAESIHSHQTGSLSIMGELREHTLSFSSVCVCVSSSLLARCLMGSLLLM